MVGEPSILYWIQSIFRFLSIFLFLTLSACLQEIPIEVETIDEQLVVEGFINDANSKHQVRLFSTIQLDNIAANSSLGIGANVQIQEIGGPVYSLDEISPGVYETVENQLIAKEGQSYQLMVSLSNGDTYQSEVEIVPPPILLSSSEARLKEEFVERSNGTIGRLIGHDLIVEIENSSEDQFFLISNRGYAEVEIGYGNCGLFGSPAGPSICWAFRDPIISNRVIIGSNKNVEGDKYLFNSINIPVDFKRPYIAILGINALSKANFNFWKSVNDQLSRPGSIFDRPIAPIIGNMIHTNGEKTALGYFHTYSTTEEVICFDRSDIQVSVNIPGPISCNLLCTDVWAPAVFGDLESIFCD